MQVQRERDNSRKLHINVMKIQWLRRIKSQKQLYFQYRMMPTAKVWAQRLLEFQTPSSIIDGFRAIYDLPEESLLQLHKRLHEALEDVIDGVLVSSPEKPAFVFEFNLTQNQFNNMVKRNNTARINAASSSRESSL